MTFWEDTARKSPYHYTVHLNLGLTYEKRGRLIEAEREYLTVVAIFPGREAIENLKILKGKIELSRQNTH